jgi:molybdopterin-guanine dinucleotide biosynthesis protein A
MQRYGKVRKFGTAVILCGGKSSRMGFDKALIKVGDRYLIDIIGEKLEQVFDNVMLVTNDLEKISCMKHKGTVDLMPGLGPVGGIYTALKASDSEYVYVTACDMPCINLGYIRLMMGVIEEESPEAVISRRGEFLEPLNAFYSVGMLDAFEEGAREGRLRISDVVAGRRVCFLDCGDEEVFANINYQSDLAILGRISTEGK